MANSLKKKTPPPPDPEQLAPDKEAEVTVTEVVKDERTQKIAGAASLLFTLFLFLAFTSYLFTWQEDQDKVQQFGIRIFATEDVRVNNLLGVLGAYCAHNFWYNGFGLASYLFCTFFFVLGVNLLFGKKIFKLLRNVKYVLVGLLVFSVGFAFATKGAAFSWGGAAGELVSAWLVKWIGNMGTGALLALAAFSYFIWRFNPTFKIPEFNFAKPANTKDEDVIPEEETLNPYHVGAVSATDNEEVVEEEMPTSNNKLKGDSKLALLEEEEADINPLNQFDMMEKEEEGEEDEGEEGEGIGEEEEIVDKITSPSVTVIQPVSRNPQPETRISEPVTRQPEPVEGLELEIKESPEEPIEEAVVAKAAVGSLATKYDATLDLKDYKYPGLNLLETHGSEKIVHDPTELETNKNQIIATLKNYDIAIQRIAATVGPTVTLYEIVPAPGVRISNWY
ncbi:MAG: hypothetical protein RL596_1903 [Bacteroidota bacterium]